MKINYILNYISGALYNKTRLLNLLFPFVLLCFPTGIVAQQTYTFTNASATGPSGPSQTQLNTAYNLTNLSGSVTQIGNGVQSWTVPASGAYGIRAIGASGGITTSGCTTAGGMGANMYGEFNLTAGQVLKILVGHQGVPSGSSMDGGGGGGTYVTTSGSVAMVVAGGGGGSTSNLSGCTGSQRVGLNASLTTTATNGANGGGAGGVNGGGGTGSGGGGGGGFISNGTGGSIVALSFMNGGLGGTYNTAGPGGFGGGGSGFWEGGNGGGGGGYSGGGTNSGSPYSGGGGGASFNSGTNQVNAVASSAGHGKVIITELCNVSLTSIGTNSQGAICAGSSVTLSTNAVSNYSWSTGNTTNSVIVVSPAVTTAYSVSGTSSLACNSSGFLTITVFPGLPSLTVANTASASSGTCPNATVILTASGATTYSWTGASTVTNGVAFAPTTTSGYTVTGTNACGSSTAALSLSIHPLPSVTGVVSQPTICSGNPITLTGVGNATNYIWNGNLANGVTQFPSITTTYTVVGWSALSCTASAFASITVVTTPLAPPIASPPLICIGSIATLSSSGANNYSWIGQSGPFSSASSVTVAPTTSTTYTLTKSNANCVNTQTVRVIVNPLPGVFAFVNPTIVCEGKPANLSAGGASSYTWTAPPSFSVTGASPIVSPIVSTMYTVTASDGTCVNQTTVFLPTNPNPTVGIVATSSTICREQTVSLTASGALAYTWTAIGLTSNSTAVSITETPTLSTLYTVVGENTFNCTTGVNQVVVVYPNPTLTISSNKPMVCVGAPANLTVTGANTYTWDSNAGGATTPVVIVNPQVTTIYTVAGTYSATGCTTVKTIPIIVFQPTFAVNSPTSSCLGGTINLIASGAQSYTWNGTSPFSQISVSPPTATVYQVAATSVSVGVTCISTNSVQVSIYANPTVIAVPQRTLICKGEITNLVGTGAFDYQWSTGQTGSLVPVNPISNTTYTILGTDQNGCIGTASLALKVSPCFGINETDHSPAFVFVYPNPSTGAFTVKTESDVFLQLFNELGQIVRTFSLTATNGREIVVEELPNGIYLLSGGNSTSTVNQKILISK